MGRKKKSCQYHLSGTCRFGNSCKNIHSNATLAYDDGASHAISSTSILPSSPPPPRLDFCCAAITPPPRGEKPLWPLSSYAWLNARNTFVTGLDVSPEELRVKAWKAALTDATPAYVKCEVACFSEARKIFQDLSLSMALTRTRQSEGEVIDASHAISPCMRLLEGSDQLGGEAYSRISMPNRNNTTLSAEETSDDSHESMLTPSSSPDLIPMSPLEASITTQSTEQYAAEPSPSNLEESTTTLSAFDDSQPIADYFQSALGALSGDRRNYLGNNPTPVDKDAITRVLDITNSLCRDVREHCLGTVEAGQLVRTNYRIYGRFGRDIRATAPNFVPFVDAAEANECKYETPSDSDEEYPDAPSVAEPVYLRDIRAHIERMTTRELPGNFPYSAKVDLITNFQATWRTLAFNCFTLVQTSSWKILRDLIHSRFGRYPKLERKLDEALSELLAMKSALCSQRLEELLQLEVQPFTQHARRLQRYKTRFLLKYKAARRGIHTGHTRPCCSTAPTSSPAPVMPSPVLGSVYGGPQILWDHANDSGSFDAFSAPEVFAYTPISPTNPLPLWPLPDISPEELRFRAVSDAVKGTAALYVEYERDMIAAADSEYSRCRSTLYHTAIANSPYARNAPQTHIKIAPSELVRGPSDPIDAMANVLKLLTRIGYSDVTADDLERAFVRDDFGNELETMADVRAYFQVAYKRVIDNVPNVIECFYTRTVGEDLQSYVLQKLRLGSTDSMSRCISYLESSSGS